MAASTLTANVGDTAASVVVTAGGTPGARAVTVIVDRSKIDDTGDVDTVLRRIADAYRERWPGLPKA